MTRWRSSARQTRRAAAMWRPLHSVSKVKIDAFHARSTLPDRPLATMQTWVASPPQPRSDHMHCSELVSIVSCRHMISAPHSLRYRPTTLRRRRLRSPRTFQVTHFMGVGMHLHLLLRSAAPVSVPGTECRGSLAIPGGRGEGGPVRQPGMRA